MGISFKIFEEYGFFLSSWVGSISDSDLLSSYKQLFENEKFKPGFHEIVDMRNAEMDRVTSDGMGRLASMVERNLSGKCEGFKTAVIAPENLPFGLSRVYEAVSSQSPEDVMVFRELNSALKWIGVDESALKPT